MIRDPIFTRPGSRGQKGTGSQGHKGTGSRFRNTVFDVEISNFMSFENLSTARVFFLAHDRLVDTV